MLVSEMIDGAAVQWATAAQLARGTDRGGSQLGVRSDDGHLTDNSLVLQIGARVGGVN